MDEENLKTSEENKDEFLDTLKDLIHPKVLENPAIEEYFDYLKSELEKIVDFAEYLDRNLNYTVEYAQYIADYVNKIAEKSEIKIPTFEEFIEKKQNEIENN